MYNETKNMTTQLDTTMLATDLLLSRSGYYSQTIAVLF